MARMEGAEPRSDLMPVEFWEVLHKKPQEKPKNKIITSPILVVQAFIEGPFVLIESSLASIEVSLVAIESSWVRT